ncbi:UNVERIFIED_CONTAM: hypothetical protein Sradi_5269200 [Sesamum radiatum]|uniref:Uncharacterized protein n=1 Tax=Sesamum radiatum TaxID=300843 RepID=A0AAW2LMV2_SESRA
MKIWDFEDTNIGQRYPVPRKGGTRLVPENEIQQNFTLVSNPQANRQVEAYCEHTAQSTRIATGETPFYLVYGSEAIIPVEIGAESAKVKLYDQAKNAEQREADMIFLQEKRELAYAKLLRYKKQAEKRYNKKVKPITFQVGDLVFEEVRSLQTCWETGFELGRSFQNHENSQK